MRGAAPAALLCLALFFNAAGGNLRTRLQKRLPDPRGILERYYTGNCWDFYSRLRFSAGQCGFTLMTDKARGEAWGDILAGGINWTPGAGPVRSVSAGWLRTAFGTGVVLSVPGSFSDVSELAMYKPPGRRNLLEPATSPWGCRGEPLTGAGAVLSLKSTDISVLVALSSLDSLSSGYHRTPSEVSGRNAFLEMLAAVRASRGGLGVTAMTASRNEGDGYGWFRAGADWSSGPGEYSTSGEIAAGSDSSGVSMAGWTALSMDTDGFRSMVMVLRNPDGFPRGRSSPPVSRECDLGACMGLRLRVFPGTVLKAGAGAYFREDGDLLLASTELDYRFPFSMEASVGLRTRTETDAFSWRSWLGSVWRPHVLISIRTRLQAAGWSDRRQDSTESGAGLEVKFRYSPAESASIDLGGAACSTDGYNSRVYAGGSAFPGVFSSTAIYGRTIMIFSQVSLNVSENLVIRGAVSRKTVDGEQSLGSGWEETEGGSRTEFGFQLDYAFR